MITQSLIKELFEYKDGHLIRKTFVRNTNVGDKAGSVDFEGYLVTQINGKKYKNHRLVFLYHYGFIPEYVDHKDNNKTNNKIENLRACDRSENNYNSKIRKDNASGIKGVSWNKAKNKWVAQIQVNRKKKHIGYFTKINDAKKEIELARSNLHGNFSNNG